MIPHCFPTSGDVKSHIDIRKQCSRGAKVMEVNQQDSQEQEEVMADDYDGVGFHPPGLPLLGAAQDQGIDMQHLNAGCSLGMKD